MTNFFAFLFKIIIRIFQIGYESMKNKLNKSINPNNKGDKV